MRSIINSHNIEFDVPYYRSFIELFGAEYQNYYTTNSQILLISTILKNIGPIQ